MLVLNLPFKALMFLTLMRPSLVLFLVLWLKLVKDFLKVRCRLALLSFLISCLIWLDLVASLPLIKERILVRSEERFSRNAETDLVCRLLLGKKITSVTCADDTTICAGNDLRWQEAVRKPACDTS